MAYETMEEELAHAAKIRRGERLTKRRETMVKVLDSLWFTTSIGTIIGLVLTENDVGVKKIRIGPGIGSASQEADEKFVAAHGSRLPKAVAQFIARADE